MRLALKVDGWATTLFEATYARLPTRMNRWTYWKLFLLVVAVRVLVLVPGWGGISPSIVMVVHAGEVVLLSYAAILRCRDADSMTMWTAATICLPLMWLILAMAVRPALLSGYPPGTALALGLVALASLVVIGSGPRTRRTT